MNAEANDMSDETKPIENHLDWGYPLRKYKDKDVNISISGICKMTGSSKNYVESLITGSVTIFPPQSNDGLGSDRRWSRDRMWSWLLQPAHRREATDGEREAARLRQGGKPKIPGGRTCLYRYYTNDDILLYIGISGDVKKRVSSHAKKSEWFEDAAKMTIEWFDLRKDAARAEKHAIQIEGPVYNISHNGSWS